MNRPFPFNFDALQAVSGLQSLDVAFDDRLRSEAPELFARLESHRNDSAEAASPGAIGALLLDVAPYLDAFLISLFEIKTEADQLKARVLREGEVAAFRQEFVMRRVKRLRPSGEQPFGALDDWLDKALASAEAAKGDRELAVAQYGMGLLRNEQENSVAITKLTEWCALALTDSSARRRFADWSIFVLPETVDHTQRVTLEPLGGDRIERKQGDLTVMRQRDGFDLTDKRASLRGVMGEVHYCLYCHENDGDFCARGFPEKKKQPDLGLKVDPLGITLTGCPLEERVSEMNVLKRDGLSLAALAMAMVDNPMIPATGHRICNDCMKACVYQKKEPVNIPEIETRVLTDVLDLPWGVEIYDLLTRWNPLRRRQRIMRPFNGRRVLVVGMGPAGFTIAHHLTMEGCHVVGVDGLKIEPLDQHLITQPVRDYDTLKEDLSERILTGFGGVAEYGITVRWDKNFLKLIYLALARRRTFQVFGGVRFGGTLTLEDTRALGFDHVCLATGAGLPKVISMGNSLARGMRQASDFLMALQLTGAAKSDSLANLQIRMPAVVIGGGLTAVDAATEVQAYYIKQVEKILDRFERMTGEADKEQIYQLLDEENAEVLEEFLAHGRAVRAERKRAEEADEAPDLVSLLRNWGGVTIVYRRGINESPAYQRNHEELIQALAEGIYYADGLTPARSELDAYGHVESLVCFRMTQQDGRWLRTSQETRIPCRCILVAAGTLPNTIYEGEFPGTFIMERDYFLPHVEHDDAVQPVDVADHCKSPMFGPFTSHDTDGHRVSFLGDTHPVFNGSVVKAIASAARSYPEIVRAMDHLPSPDSSDSALGGFRALMSEKFEARIERIENRHPMITEMWIRAPLAARNFAPGQFYRLQTFEKLSAVIEDTRLQIPLQTISGAGVDGDLVRLILLRWGANAKIAGLLEPGQPVILMGPTGAPFEIQNDKTILVISGTWGAAVMLGLAPQLRAAGNRVLYFAAYGSQEEIYCREELEAASDSIVWCTHEEAVTDHRRQDAAVRGLSMSDTIRRYGRGEIGPGPMESRIDLKTVDEVFVMGSTRLLKELQQGFAEDLAAFFRDDVKLLGTVGSPMQCMMKGVCGQCLQWQIDPNTGERTRAVFSCAMQDQPLRWIDVENLAARQGQTRLQETLTGLWVDHVLRSHASVGPSTGNA